MVQLKLKVYGKKIIKCRVLHCVMLLIISVLKEAIELEAVEENVNKLSQHLKISRINPNLGGLLRGKTTLCHKLVGILLET